MNDQDPTSSFSQFRNYDPRARLDDFNRRFEEIKKQFHSKEPRMFESNPGWTTTAANSAMGDNHPNLNAMNGEQKQQAAPNNSFPSLFSTHPNHPQHRFQREFEADEDLEQQGHRVHHIPIHIEPRTGGGGSNRASRDSSPMPQSTTARTPTPQQQIRQPQQFAPASNQTQQQPTQEEIFRTKSASPRVQSIPIQICKSSSAGSTATSVYNQPEVAEQQNQSNNPINESASDPIIADPNKVYAMNYEPPVPQQKANQSEPETGNKVPEVVAMPYENTKTTNEKQSTGEEEVAQKTKQETPFDYVDEIILDLRNYEDQVNEIQPTGPDDKGYLWLDEMLTLCVLRLDCINIDGNDELRKYRKNAINAVNLVSAKLEAKVPRDTRKPESDAPETAVQVASDNSITEKPTKEKKGVFSKIFKKKNQNSSETDRNNNPNSSSSDQASASETGSNSSGSAVTLPGRETEV